MLFPPVCLPLPTMFAPELRALWWKRRFVGWRLVETSCCLAVSLGILATWLIITTDYSSRKKWVRFVFPPAFTWLSGQPWKKKVVQEWTDLSCSKGKWLLTADVDGHKTNVAIGLEHSESRRYDPTTHAGSAQGCTPSIWCFQIFISFFVLFFFPGIIQSLCAAELGFSWERGGMKLGNILQIFCYFLISYPVKIPFLSSHTAPQRSAWWKQHWARRRRVLGCVEKGSTKTKCVSRPQETPAHLALISGPERPYIIVLAVDLLSTHWHTLSWVCIRERVQNELLTTVFASWTCA